jgi:hypothetical protein
VADDVKKNRLLITLDDELRRRLEVEAERSGFSLAEVIRARMRSHFREKDSQDRETRSLATAVPELAEFIATATGFKWTDHPDAREALMVALAVYAEAISPLAKGEVADFGYEPKTVGKLLALTYHRRSKETAEMLEQMEAEDRAYDEAEARRIFDEPGDEYGVEEAPAEEPMTKRRKPPPA